MKLLKKINAACVVETAAVETGSVASAPLPLFSSLIKRSKPEVKAIEPVIANKKGLQLGEAFKRLSEDLTNSAAGDEEGAARQAAVDTADTIARLKSLETKDSTDKRNVVIFGLEDDNNGIVRVSVRPDQAKEFEQALQGFINDSEQDGDTPEIAELLFSMRDHFDIVDVEWPEVAEDEEQVSDISPEDMPADGMDETDPMADPAIDVAPPDTTEVTTLLKDVIDMMKADAAARHADAKAREEEAKVRQASAIVNQATARIKQEEQFLDMEQANKMAKEEQKETKRLAQLAKWKRDVEVDTGVGDFDDADITNSMGGVEEPTPQQMPVGGNREEEEVHRTRTQGMPQRRVPVKPTGKPRVAPRDIASFILNRVQ